VIDRKGDSFTLRYRDYPQLPKFVRHRSAIALMNPPTDEAKPEAQIPAGLTLSGPPGPNLFFPLKNQSSADISRAATFRISDSSIGSPATGAAPRPPPGLLA
jgi:hypothetical protein